MVHNFSTGNAHKLNYVFVSILPEVIMQKFKFEPEAWPAYDYSCLYITDLFEHFNKLLELTLLKYRDKKLSNFLHGPVTLLVIGKATSDLIRSLDADTKNDNKRTYLSSKQVSYKDIKDELKNTDTVVYVAYDDNAEHLEKLYRSVAPSDERPLTVLLCSFDNRKYNSQPILVSPSARTKYASPESLLGDIDDLLERGVFDFAKQTAKALDVFHLANGNYEDESTPKATRLQWFSNYAAELEKNGLKFLTANGWFFLSLTFYCYRTKLFKGKLESSIHEYNISFKHPGNRFIISTLS